MLNYKESVLLMVFYNSNKLNEMEKFLSYRQYFADYYYSQISKQKCLIFPYSLLDKNYILFLKRLLLYSKLFVRFNKTVGWEK